MCYALFYCQELSAVQGPNWACLWCELAECKPGVQWLQVLHLEHCGVVVTVTSLTWWSYCKARSLHLVQIDPDYQMCTKTMSGSQATADAGRA